MKITFFEVSKEEQDVLTASFSGLDFNISFFEEKINAENAHLAQDAEVVSVFVNSEVNKEIIDKLSSLKFIATRSTGFDHIDVSYCNSKGIQVSNVPSYGSRTVAEFAFSLLLSISRKASIAGKQVCDNGDFSQNGFEGFDLFGKTIGIIGTGKIGKNAARIAKGFGMRVLATDLYPDSVFGEEEGVEYVPLPELLSASDIVTIHAPYNETTFHLINKENIKQFKKGAYLINTARGEIIETEAILMGLKEGVLAGAGLDVLEAERKLKDEVKFLASGKASEEDKKILGLNHELIKMPNVTVTPHIAFYTKEAVADILKTAAQNIKDFAAGSLNNLVK